MFNRSYFAAAFFALSYFPGPLPVPPPVCLHAEVAAPAVVVGAPSALSVDGSVGGSHTIDLALQGPTLTLLSDTASVFGEVSSAPSVELAGAAPPSLVLTEPSVGAMTISITSPNAALAVSTSPAAVLSIGSATVTLVAEEC